MDYLYTNDIAYKVYAEVKTKTNGWTCRREWVQRWSSFDSYNPYTEARQWVTDFGLVFDAWRVFDQDGVVWMCGERY